MNRVQLDQQRADMMDALYERSGRTCSTYTGLWEEFCGDIAANFRDTSYPELLARVVRNLLSGIRVPNQRLLQPSTRATAGLAPRWRWYDRHSLPPRAAA